MHCALDHLFRVDACFNVDERGSWSNIKASESHKPLDVNKRRVGQVHTESFVSNACRPSGNVRAALIAKLNAEKEKLLNQACQDSLEALASVYQSTIQKLTVGSAELEQVEAKINELKKEAACAKLTDACAAIRLFMANDAANPSPLETKVITNFTEAWRALPSACLDDDSMESSDLTDAAEVLVSHTCLCISDEQTPEVVEQLPMLPELLSIATAIAEALLQCVL
eukprot:6484169-Amphidinium_carterae.2